MATYILLNIAVLVVVLAGLLLWRALQVDKSMLITMVLLLITTAVFDSLMIYFDFFAYNPERILGVFVWLAPVEDFWYALAAGIVIPSVWSKLGRNDGKTDTTV